MKKLIVLATLAALPAVAMADVTISGNLAVGVVNSKTSGESDGSRNTLNRTSGEIKFAGSDDLGNGLKAVWQIATKIDQADPASGAGWATRDSYVGVDGSFGRLTAGNIYVMPTSGALAIFENNSATFESAIYDKGTRYNNTVSYKAPVVAGLTATVQHSFGATSAKEDADKAVGVQKYADALSLAYEIGAVSLSYDTVSEKQNAQGKKKKLHELNASVGLDALTLQAGYARGKDDSTNIKRSGWGLAASYAMGNVTPKIGYWREGDSKENGVANNDGHKAFAVGVEYALSKRTRTGVEFAKANYDAAGEGSLRTATVYLGTKF